jgi:hypothetical protein
VEDHCIGRSAELLVSIETVGKMTTIKEKVVELSVESSNTKKFSESCWEGGNEMMAGARFVVILFP